MNYEKQIERAERNFRQFVGGLAYAPTDKFKVVVFYGETNKVRLKEKPVKRIRPQVEKPIERIRPRVRLNQDIVDEHKRKSVEPHPGVIYMLTAPDGRRWIGRTNNYERRMKDYRLGRGPGLAGESVAEHGWENHVHRKIAQGIEIYSLPRVEKAFIEMIKPELNQKDGSVTGHVQHTEKAKRTIGEKNAVANLGNKHSPESKAKMSASHIRLHQIRRIHERIKELCQA